MAKTITCPYCFNIYPVNEVGFRCTNTHCDDYNQPFEQPDGGRGLLGGRKVITSAACPTCGQESYKRICPYCDFELVHDAGLTDEYTVAVIGGRAAGKSMYIASLIHRLRNEVGLNFQAGVGAMTDQTRERFQRDFEIPLFQEKRLLPMTQSAGVDAQVKEPMIFRITFAGARRSKAVNLVLFDTAGEDMQSLDTLSQEARYICFADGLIFLLDPLQIGAVRDQLIDSEVEVPPRLPGAQPKLIVERLRQLYERQFKLKPTRRIKKPVAFTLAKVDALFGMLDPASGLLRTGEHFGYLNRVDVQSIHTEITSHLLSWMGPDFDNFVKANFSNYHYFGVSALGQPPKKGASQLEGVAPHRVEDPLLWIFREFGLIKER